MSIGLFLYRNLKIESGIHIREITLYKDG
jgi:hypothetical protein